MNENRARRLTDRESMFMLENEYNRAMDRVMKNISKVESFTIPAKDGDKTLVAEHTFFKEPPEEYRNLRYSIYYTDEE